MGQSGSFVIFLGRDLKAVNNTAKMGIAIDVMGKLTVAFATVMDTLDETNWTSFTVLVKEGTQITKFGPYSKEAATNLDTIC